MRTDDSGIERDRGVSPVIGVILMVAITVILAAVIAAFVLDLGSGLDSDAQASVTIEGDGTSSVTVTVQAMQDADGVAVLEGGNLATDGVDDEAYAEGVGEQIKFSNNEASYVVVAYYNGHEDQQRQGEAVIGTFDLESDG